jgi:signal peptidase I
MRRLLRHPLAHLVVALTLIALVQAVGVKAYQVPTESMTPALAPGDRILVDRVTTALGTPQRGDLVVFERHADWDDAPPADRPAWRVAAGWIGDTFGFGPTNADTLVKRVLAVPGDTLRCCDDEGRMLRNDAPLAEPYVMDDLPFTPSANDCTTTSRSPRCFDEIALGADEYLVGGDNRAVSLDSLSGCRGESAPADCARTVHRSDIVGVVFFRFWPVPGWGGVGDG